MMYGCMMIVSPIGAYMLSARVRSRPSTVRYMLAAVTSTNDSLTTTPQTPSHTFRCGGLGLRLTQSTSHGKRQQLADDLLSPTSVPSFAQQNWATTPESVHFQSYRSTRRANGCQTSSSRVLPKPIVIVPSSRKLQHDCRRSQQGNTG